MDALSFLTKSKKAARQPIYVLIGDEAFLKTQCRDAIRRIVVGDADLEFALATYPGDKTPFSEVRNDLDTLPFLAPARLVEIESADPFVTEYRESLEKYAAKPSNVGVLTLDVKSFPETTRLAKAISDDGKIVCKAPDEAKLADWCIRWARTNADKPLTDEAADLLLTLIGPEMGLLASEIEKLAVAIGNKQEIGPADVQQYVGRSRQADVFKILDDVGAGKPAEAISLLTQLLDEGDDPLAILGPMTYQLRKLASIDRFLSEEMSLASALDAAKVPKWDKVRDATNRQLKHLGRRRLMQLSEWLTDLNFGLKGGCPLEPRVQLERLLARLAKAR
jgi:DNA polymerase III subunit delta